MDVAFLGKSYSFVTSIISQEFFILLFGLCLVKSTCTPQHFKIPIKLGQIKTLNLTHIVLVYFVVNIKTEIIFYDVFSIQNRTIQIVETYSKYQIMTFIYPQQQLSKNLIKFFLKYSSLNIVKRLVNTGFISSFG